MVARDTSAYLVLVMATVVACTMWSPRNPETSLGFPEILRVDAVDSVGSAVPIHLTKEGLWCLTAKHISRGGKVLTVGGFPIQRSIDHPSLDLQLLKVDGLARTLKLSSRGPKPGEHLRAIGFHLGDFLAMTDGYQGPLPRDMSCQILFGASGGAVINDQGELVGIIKALMKWTSSQGVDLPASFLSRYVPLTPEVQDWIQETTRG